MREVWGKDTIKSLLRKGYRVDEVEKTHLVERIIAIYTLMYEADAYEAAHGPIATSELITNLLAGKFNFILWAISNKRQGDLTLQDGSEAEANAGH
jgi:hypothetical protein